MNYLLGLALNLDPPNLGLPKVARIIGVNHWGSAIQLLSAFFMKVE
jgi:hypothetical protein